MIRRYKYILLLPALILPLSNNLSSMTSIARLSKRLGALHITKNYKSPIIRVPKRTLIKTSNESKEAFTFDAEQQKEVNRLLDKNIVAVFKSIYTLDKDDDLATLQTSTHLPWLSSCMVKLDTSRIRGAEKMRACIAKNNLKLIVLPVQWEYTLPEAELKKELELLEPKKISRAFIHPYFRTIYQDNVLLQDLPTPSKVCVAQRLECTGKKPLTLCQVQEMVVLIEQLGWWDCSPKNYVNMHDKIGIIDTEERGLHGSVKLGFKLLLQSPLDEDARKYVQKKLNDF